MALKETAHLVRRKSDSSPFVIKKQCLEDYKVVTNEVNLLKKMRHPNIVMYHDSWKEGQQLFILMEYASRGTLKQYLSRRRVPLQEEDALYLFAQMVLGVHHIHKKMVLHRDLKPGNIMLSGPRGDVVKIGDFGVSKNIAREMGVTRVGTKCYMAPEVLKGTVYDYKCDIWSLGVILYEMLTKRFPFNVRSQVDLIRQICQGVLSPLQRGDASSAVRNLTYKMLDTKPEGRPKSRDLVLCPTIIPHIGRVYKNLDNVDRAMIIDQKVSS
ncbi:serine/threonine-protein kinase Nek8-like isoform X2 [Orussus abietinus]|uniref:serine/threonine-protein kinase Nek8-like isoform X2 n=1 Tax=Orussus abietinus TaxID=222816 RepID=UPI00062517AD|nr:serine/threonine-protein kinase Nek8-like isoform X2 [Orussus abietinus]